MKKVFAPLIVCLCLAACSNAQKERIIVNETSSAQIDSLINDAIEAEKFPGAVVAVVRGEKMTFLKAYGNRSLVPEAVPMSTETVFDLASLSKCVGTTTAAMQLIEDGKLSPDDDVRKYIPEFLPWKDGDETVHITVRDIMTHSSGLDAYADVEECVERYGECRPDSLMRHIALESGRNFRPGTRFLYSCLNFVTLQNIIQNITGERLCDYVQENVFDRLGMRHTCYLPYGTEVPEEWAIAPTEVQSDGTPLYGRVHDPLARRLNGGNSGNAGVFSNAEDLALFCIAIMNGGSYRGRRILGESTVNLMTEVPECNEAEVGRALGWDVSSSHSYILGEFFPEHRCICHTGYTGTSIVMDMDSRIAVILLTNRAHPYDGGTLRHTREALSDIVAQSSPVSF